MVLILLELLSNLNEFISYKVSKNENNKQYNKNDILYKSQQYTDNIDDNEIICYKKNRCECHRHLG